MGRVLKYIQLTSVISYIHTKNTMFKSLLLVLFAFATITAVQGLDCYKFPNDLESSKGKVSPVTLSDLKEEDCKDKVTHCFKAEISINSTVLIKGTEVVANFKKQTYGCNELYEMKEGCHNGVCACSEDLCNKLELNTNSAPSEKFNVIITFSCLFVALFKITY